MTAKRYVARVFLAIAIGTFVLGGFLTTSHLGTDMQREGSVGLCPFMPGVAICNMTPMQHIAAAQSMFTALPVHADFSTILLAFLAAVVGFLPLLRRTFFPPILASISLTVRRDGYIPTHSALQEVFARGILNPKLF